MLNQREEYLAAENKLLPYEERSYFCRVCKKVETSVGIPDGWYVVKKSHGQNETLKTAAIACSIGCLAVDSVQALAVRYGNY